MNKWQEGKRYKLKASKVSKFIDQNGSNKRIFYVIGEEVFTVKTVDSAGRVLELAEYSVARLELCYWFSQSELNFFELVEDMSDTPTVTDANVIRPDADIIVEWLEKLTYVLQTDPSVDDSLNVKPEGIVLDADYCIIYGATGIYDFITKRYDLLQQEVKHKKNNELMERKAKLEAELAEVVASLQEIK